MNFPNFTLKTIEEIKFFPQKVILTKILLISRNENEMNQQIIYHYRYTDWPDHSIPNSFEGLKDLLSIVHEKYSILEPIIVHCSAGIGRTGAFCVIDICTRLKIIEASQVLKVILNLRRQRTKMVETKVNKRI